MWCCHLTQEYGVLQDGRRSDFSFVGFGMRARRRNRRPSGRMSSTWRTIVSVHWSTDRTILLIDLPAVAAFQPLGRELDRRQRVLDLGAQCGERRPPRRWSAAAITRSVMSSTVDDIGAMRFVALLPRHLNIHRALGDRRA